MRAPSSSAPRLRSLLIEPARWCPPPTRLLLGLVLALGATTTTARAQDQGQGNGAALRANTFGPGPLHKVFVEARDEYTRDGLRSSGSVVREIDYGAFSLFLVDEVAFGGRAVLRAAGLDIRDEHDLLSLNGVLLDGRRPAASLAGVEPRLLLGDAGAARVDPGAGLYLVQFVGPLRDAWLERLVAAGARPVQSVPMNGYVVSVAPERVASWEDALRDDEAIQHVGPWHPVFRLTPEVRAAARVSGGQPIAMTIQLVDGRGVRDALEAIEELSLRVEGSVAVGPYRNLAVVMDPSFAPILARHPAVFAIEGRGTRARRDERQGQTIAGNVGLFAPLSATYLIWLANQGFDDTQFGTFAVNVVDDAYSIVGHPDLPFSRIEFQINPTNQTGVQEGHGFLNAHIVAGFNNQTGSAYEDASGYQYGLGIAPWARVGATAIFGPTFSSGSTWENLAYANNSRISSNSWSFVDQFQNPIPDYNSSAQEYDFIVRDARSGVSGNQEYMVLFAAGNDGPGSNTVSSPSTAKNILTVGASENNRQTGTDGCGVTNTGANQINDMIGFSSRGPVDSAGGDGRWKPEISAPGTHVQAGVPQSNYNGAGVCNQYWPGGQTLYGWSSGTSHSTPGVAGGAALVRQWFINEGMGIPSPAMLKAVIVNSASYMTGINANDTLPSNSQGQGLMNLGRAFDTTGKLYVDQSQVLSTTGASYVLNGTVDDAGEPFRVSLVWTDAPGSTSGGPWVNDLDLTVVVGGNLYRGNVFSGADSITGGSADFRNNTESVFLPAGSSGSFSVTVTAASIAGDGIPGNGDSTDQDFALVVHNGTTGGGPQPPVAAFTANPVSGVVPLNVAFSDLSTGDVTSWAWTFGDGGTSTQQNPSHNYTAVGSYDVSLTATGPLGSDVDTQFGFVTVTAAPPPGVSDGSFESQSAGTAPTTPWNIAFGSGHIVSPSGVSSDNGMPTDGTQWCELAADSTNGATPPSNPGGVTNPPVGGAGISQTFSYGAGVTELSFEAAFLRNEDPDSTYNDWLSVDVSDGSTWVNLFYRDTFSATSGTSSKYGYAMTPVATTTVDLVTLFPASTTSTVFTLTALVGNGDDDFQPSKGYIDDVRMSGTAAPPVAEFSGTPLSGQAPLDVDFTDLSTGTVTSWAWGFGDGGSSTQQNPSHTYTSAGSYNVLFTATGPGGNNAELKSAYVTVTEAAPSADFSVSPVQGIAPLLVDFTDQTTGNVTSWSWTFGDGGTSSAQNPSYSYTAPGLYTVSLTATGPGGSDIATQVDVVDVNDVAPVAAFSGTPTSGAAPLLVDFSDQSSGPITSWSWIFGDGGTSTQPSPSHTYTTPGNYAVILTVTGPGGVDAETKLNYVSVSQPAPVADFLASPTSGTLPLDVAFTDQTTGSVTSWAWTFGDGGTSTAQNPNYVYNSAGTYSVTLTATGPGGSDGETKTNLITVDEPAPVAEFGASVTSGTAPLAVDFTDQSTGGPVTSWSWIFGDGGTSTQQNPSYVYTAPGTYTVILTATGPGGVDAETKLNLISVSEPAPVAEFLASPTSGTLPLAVNFTDQTTGNATSWAWTFGDGGTSTAQNPSHVYTTSGTYSVTLTATGPGGSDGETKTDLISVAVPAPAAEFIASPTSGTLPLPVDFTDQSTGDVTSWSWTFGDGGTSTAQNPSHVYTAAGTYSVTLTATGPGGGDGETKTDLITVSEQAPLAEFSASPTSGTLPLLVDFTDLSTGGPATSWAWTFGDGGTSTQRDPGHTYTTAGTYSVTLTATGPGGSDDETKVNLITVAEPAPVAAFTADTTLGIAPLTVGFTDLSTGGPVTSWVWDFGDGGNSIDQHPSHEYLTPGTYSVSLTVTGPGGSDVQTAVDLVRVVPDPWADLGQGLAGTSGIPLLEGTGTLVGGQPMSIDLSGARANAPATFIGGVGTFNLPFKGGVLVPDFTPPGFTIPLVTNGAGDIPIADTWPEGFPPGFVIYFQYWVLDPVGVQGFAASNAISATTP